MECIKDYVHTSGGMVEEWIGVWWAYKISGTCKYCSQSLCVSTYALRNWRSDRLRVSVAASHSWFQMKGVPFFCEVAEFCHDVRKVVYIASLVVCEAQELASLGNICWDWPFLHNLYFLAQPVFSWSQVPSLNWRIHVPDMTVVYVIFERQGFTHEVQVTIHRRWGKSHQFLPQRPQKLCASQ